MSTTKGTQKGRNVLLHTCCAPCTSYVHPRLIKEDYDVTGYFYNPNIHPYTEYEKRLMTMRLYAVERDFPVIYDEQYDIENFFDITFKKGDKRCLYCYMLRLHKTANYAKKHAFDLFSTTLLLSPYQKHDLLREAGEIIAKKIGIPLLYLDLRPGYPESVRISREMNLYRQKYCGCLFSERDRFMTGRKAENF